MKKNLVSTICLMGVAGTALIGQQFTVVRKAPNWDPRAPEGSCEVRVWVDNTAEIGLQGERVFVRTLAGQPARDAGTTCTAPLPRAGATDLRVRGMEGRGTARLLEQPNAQNGYMAVFRVEDPQSGGSEYNFRVDWRAQGATFFTDRDYDREWDRSRWDPTRQDHPVENRHVEGPPPVAGNVDRGWRSDHSYRRQVQAVADGWGRIHPEQREGQRISRLEVRTERDDDAIITLDTDRGPMRFMGRIQSQDDRSIGISLRDAMGRPAEGFASIHFDASGNLQSATLEGKWGGDNYVASFNRRYR